VALGVRKRVTVDDALRRLDLSVAHDAPRLLAVRAGHAEVPGPARAEVHLALGDWPALRAEPVLDALPVRVRLEDQLAGIVERARDLQRAVARFDGQLVGHDWVPFGIESLLRFLGNRGEPVLALIRG